MAAPRWLDEDESRAWRGWVMMTEGVRARIAQDLQAVCNLSTPDFAVLVNLSETTGGRMRMTELADALGWSKSRVSHQCSRMAARGLVAREGCPDDARSSYAVLTACGRHEIERAAPHHVESARRHLVDLLDRGQILALATITEQVLAHLGATVTAPDDECSGRADACPSAVVDGGPVTEPVQPPR